MILRLAILCLLVAASIPACGSRVAHPTDAAANDAHGDAPPHKPLPRVSTWAGIGCNATPKRSDGPRLQATLGAVGPLAPTSDGKLYFCDSGALRVVDDREVKTIAIDALVLTGCASIAVQEQRPPVVANRRAVYEVRSSGVALLAGNPAKGAGAHVDGPAARAQFEGIRDVVADGPDRLLIADHRPGSDHGYVRLLSGGKVSTLVGQDRAGAPRDGLFGSALMAQPGALLKVAGGFYLADLNLLRWLAHGELETLAGSFGRPYEVVDGELGSARFSPIVDLTASSGMLYLLEDAPGRRVRTLNGESVRSLTNGMDGFRDGPVDEALFLRPTHIAVGAGGDLFIADSGNCRIRRIQLAP